MLQLDGILQVAYFFSNWAKSIGFLSFRTTENFDLQGMSNLIFEAIREKPDGLVISLPNSTFIGPAIQVKLIAG